MVNLIWADPSHRVRRAAAMVAAEWDGILETHVERLRSRYRREKKAGQLPQPDTPESRLALQIGEVKALYAERAAWIEGAKRQLAAAEQEAKSLGFHLDPELLISRLDDLKEERSSLESLLTAKPAFLFSALLDRGITSPEEGAKYIAAATVALRNLNKAIGVLGRAVELRSRIKLALSPQEP
jgi:hypothetical protein